MRTRNSYRNLLNHIFFWIRPRSSETASSAKGYCTVVLHAYLPLSYQCNQILPLDSSSLLRNNVVSHGLDILYSSRLIFSVTKINKHYSLNTSTLTRNHILR